MDKELEVIDKQMKDEISVIRAKYNDIKKEIRKKYKKTEPKKPRKSIPKTVKSDTWNKYIGKEKGIGKCECCSNEIDSKNFECGHVKSVKDGGDETVENLRPICSECNKSMGTENLYDFKKKHYPKNLNFNATNLLIPQSRKYGRFGSIGNVDGYPIY
jgi:5-methylcytosine-specific restriction endonuclease McrA